MSLEQADDQECAECISLREKLNKYSEDEMLCAWTARISELEQQLAASQKREVMLRDKLQDALWGETWWRVEAKKALAATEAELAHLILCEKEPVAWYNKASHQLVWSYKTDESDIPLYHAARRPE